MLPLRKLLCTACAACVRCWRGALLCSRRRRRCRCTYYAFKKFAPLHRVLWREDQDAAAAVSTGGSAGESTSLSGPSSAREHAQFSEATRFPSTLQSAEGVPSTSWGADRTWWPACWGVL